MSSCKQSRAEAIAIENQQAIDELERGAIHFHDEENDEMAAGSSQCQFRGYTKLYTEAVETECQLSSEAALGIAPELYHKLKSTHETVWGNFLGFSMLKWEWILDFFFLDKCVLKR